MKISLKWLNEYIDVKEFFSNPEGLSQILTAAGLEVESIENQAKPFDQVVVGQVKVLDRHPDADKLTLCQVDVGEKDLRQIVCGAKNHKQGDKVVVTLPGAVLPGNFEIKESKIRGVKSQGMMASKKELGLSEESEGILILPEDAKVGQPFAQFAGLDDVIFELSVTPNRADCLSHWGLARELSLSLKRSPCAPVINLKTSPLKAPIELIVKDVVRCPRYAGRWIKGVKVAPSPDWLRQRLEGLGFSSINNVVDVTNFVMLELGQPLHAFDLSQIKGAAGSTGAQLIVDRAKDGEEFKTLDGSTLKLSPDDLTIRDGSRTLALAGLIGGENSGVKESTTDLFVESAFFQAQAVRRAGRRHGVETESGQRFSRGVDPEAVRTALDRACALIAQVAGGEVSEALLDFYPAPIERNKVTVRAAYICERLGSEIAFDEIEEILRGLQCQMVSKTETEWSVVPPAFRWDLQDEWDFVEEVARLRNYNRISETFAPLLSSPQLHDSKVQFDRKIEDLMVLESFRQAMHYHFVSEVEQDALIQAEEMSRLGLKTSDSSIRLKNPLSQDLNVMRKSLIVSMLSALQLNLRQGVERGLLFELGRVYGEPQALDEESVRVAGLGWGEPEGLWIKSAVPQVYQLKATLEALLNQLQIKSYRWIKLGAEKLPSFLHPGQSVKLNVEGQDIGFVGALHPMLKEKEKIKTDAAIFEVSVDALRRGQPRKLKIKEFSKYPGVRKDLAFVMPNEVEAGSLLPLLTKGLGALATSVEVFDLYQGAPLKEGQKSVTYRTHLQKLDGTLTEAELQQAMQAATEAVKKKLGFELR